MSQSQRSVAMADGDLSMPSMSISTRSRNRKVQRARVIDEAKVVSGPNIVLENSSNECDSIYSGDADNESECVPDGEVWLPQCANAIAYLDACEKYDIKIDPNIVICLQSRWNILQPSFQFVEGSLLPLMGVLDKNTHVLKANFSYAGMKDPRFRFSGNGNSNARVLRYILTKNKCIQELNLSNTGLDDDGVNEICEGIKKNNTLHSLNLSSNHFGEIGAEKLRLALEQNNSIKQIDLSQNALGFRSINSIVCSCGPKHIVIQTHGNFVFEEILNSVSHGIAFLASVVGANLLLTSAAESKNYTDYHFWACILYSCALMFLFLSSCLFHSFFMMPSTSRVLQILDHVGIYGVIAGSYTPMLLIGLHHHNSARILVVLEWIGAVCGSVFAAVSDLNAPMTTKVELCIFLSMGAAAVGVWNLMVQQFSFPALVLLVLGGVAYLAGIPFFLMGEVDPKYHVIWHLFVIAGAAFHWFFTYFFVLDTDIGMNITNETTVSAAVSMMIDNARNMTKL